MTKGLRNIANRCQNKRRFLLCCLATRRSISTTWKRIVDVESFSRLTCVTYISLPGSFDSTEVVSGIRQLYIIREGWLAPFPWCEEFHFHLDDIFTRLKMVSRKKTRGATTSNIVEMSAIFQPHEECPKPRTVLIEGKPGMPTAIRLLTIGPPRNVKQQITFLT